MSVINMSNYSQLIIVEGPDGAGKTTLIEQLRKQLDVKHFTHHGAYAGELNIAQHYLNSMLPALTGQGTTMLDRSWLAEPIYGAAFRNGADRVGYVRARMLERCALTCRAVVIKCLPAFDTCARHFVARKAVEYLDNVEQLRAVHDSYRSLSMRTDLNVVVYDYEKSGAYDMLLRHLQRLPAPTAQVGIGWWIHRRSVLLVGEQLQWVGAKLPDNLDLPFVRFDNSGCPTWLTRELELFGIRERGLHWINARTPDGRETSPAFVKILEPRAVVALGSTAASWCKQHNVQHTHVKHPQYWRRFFHHKHYDLMEVLLKIKHKQGDKS